MPLGDLTQAWVAASAALPLQWELVGVWLDPDRPGWWQAVARGPGDSPEIMTGRGSHIGLALNDLANRLRERRGSATGSNGGSSANVQAGDDSPHRTGF